jgi:hypothetical protein
MPVTYERDDSRRLITVKVTEPVSLRDILGVVDRQAAEDTWRYAMLYDLQAVKDVGVLAHLPQIADRVKALGGDRPRGPVGVAIVPRPELFLAGLMYGELTREFMSVEILLTAGQLEDWLSRNAPRRSSNQP